LSSEGPSAFGVVLRRLRSRAELSQEQLAERAGLSSESIGALERGTRRAPYRETVELLAVALDVSPEERAELEAAARRPRRTAALPLASVRPQTVPNNLPFEASRLFGREQALADAGNLLADHRVVTIVGAGGVGKTRLALALAAARASEPNLDGIWFVEMAPLVDAGFAPNAVAQALGVGESAGTSVETSIVRNLQAKSGLLVLDNCEHVAARVAELVEAIRAACPGIRVLATSRRRLEIEGEAVYRLPSLDVPAANERLQPDEALRYGAVALFVDRASAVDPSFRLSPANVALVTDVCSQLDGIALAIELAAARSRVLSVASLARLLTERFRLLTGGNPRAMRRQRTLSATIDWSYDMLAPADRTLLNRIAIFAGGFDLEAAGSVCADAGRDAFDLLDPLASLVEQSLLSADIAADGERYRLLESTRAYALERLETYGERELLARRHAQYFANVARAADAAYGTEKTTLWLARLEPDTSNFRSALEWSFGPSGDPVIGAAIAGSLERFWINDGLEVEGRRWIGLALERLSEDAVPEAAARLWRARAWLTVSEAKCDAALEACRLYERGDDVRGLGDALKQLALGYVQMGRYAEALAPNARAIEIFRSCGDRRNLANGLDMAATIALARGERSAAREAYAEALTLFRGLDNEGGAASVLIGLSMIAYLDDDPNAALQAAEAAFEIYRLGKYGTNLAIVHILLSTYRLELGEPAAARREVSDALTWARGTKNPAMVPNALLAASAVAAALGDGIRGARLLGYAEATLETLRLEHSSAALRVVAKTRESLRALLPDPKFAALEREGRAWPEERALREFESMLPAGETAAPVLQANDAAR
jgi:predicted ATPase/DNA-binding XRE family transcriptional regulator